SKHFAAITTNKMKTLLNTRILPTNLGFLAVAAVTLAAMAVLPVPLRGEQTKSFCEAGSAVALQFGAGGAVWSQTWGLPGWSWLQCDASPNIGFLDQNVVGRQATTTSGSPAIDANLVLQLPFQGTITLTAYEEEDATQVAGEIIGRMSGSFVADLNAAHAVI